MFRVKDGSTSKLTEYCTHKDILASLCALFQKEPMLKKKLCSALAFYSLSCRSLRVPDTMSKYLCEVRKTSRVHSQDLCALFEL